MPGILELLAEAAAQSPTARALRNTRAVNVPDASQALGDPEVMARIRQLAGVLDQNGGMASPTSGGQVAELTGRMPVMTQGFGQSGAPLPPELEQALVDMAQPRDAAVAPMDSGRAYNLRKAAAKAKADAIAAEAEREASFSDVGERAQESAINTSGQVDPRVVAEYQRKRDDPGRQAAFQKARDNVTMMSMAGGVARADRMGQIPQGVDPAGMLGAIAPTQDMQMQINPGPTGQLRGIEAFDRDSQRDAQAATDVANIGAKAEMARAKILAKSQKASDRIALKQSKLAAKAGIKQTEMELKSGEALRESQIALTKAQLAVAQAEAATNLALSPFQLEEAKGKAELNKQLLEKEKFNHTQAMKTADLTAKAADTARKYDPFPEIEEPELKTAAWSEKVAPEVADKLGTATIAEIEANPGAKTPKELKWFMSHVYANRDKLYGASWMSTNETDFENYLIEQLPDIKPEAVRIMAEHFFESR